TFENETQFAMLKKLELSVNAHKVLIKYCKRKKIKFLSSAFDLKSIDLLDNLGVKIFKIPSGEINNLPYLRKVGRLHKTIILSTGMSSLKEIKEALKILLKEGTLKKNITILHCNSEYPTPFFDVNLLAMLTLKNTFDIKVGYSDHTLGIEIPIAAVALGADVIEKHFTLSKKKKGPDHSSSLEPNELKSMVKAIRNIEISLGESIKRPSPSELKNRSLVRKSIIAKRYIKKGEVFDESNITTKRPDIGLNPMLWDRIMGKSAKKEFNKDEAIKL
ncbi:MAG: N-acetylneuraminate synthase, partial [Candidatus Omnitrophica bacterium]|nr:N-acetylneuraminate synthase [Candidatus Omnitrophota bacterium]